MKKFFLILVLLFTAFFWTAQKPVLAQDSLDQGSSGANPFIEYKDKLTNPIDTSLDQWIGGSLPKTAEGKRANGVIDSIIMKGVSLLIGLPDNKGSFSSGIIGVSGMAMGSMFDHPPASGVTYVADLLHNAGFAKPAYAQGVGFTGLAPVLKIWKAFRDLAYILITVLIIVLGLMIMFRVKLDPRTVISIQSAIPKIAVALILITFSYAIAGFLIDLSNLVLVIVIRVLGSTGLIDPTATTSDWLNTGIGTTIGRVLSNLVNGIYGILFSNVVTGAGGVVGAAGIVAIIGGALAGSGLAMALAPALLAILFGVLLAIVGLIIKIFTMLIKAYVSIIIGVVMGPLQIIFDVLPGQKSSAFNSWAKGLLANILVFPVVAILFILGDIFDKALGLPGQAALWTPPTLSTNNMMISAFIKIGILMIIPNVDKVIMQALDIKTSLGSSLGRDPLLDKPGRYFDRDMKARTFNELGGEVSSIGTSGTTKAPFWDNVGKLVSKFGGK